MSSCDRPTLTSSRLASLSRTVFIARSQPTPSIFRTLPTVNKSLYISNKLRHTSFNLSNQLPPFQSANTLRESSENQYSKLQTGQIWFSRSIFLYSIKPLFVRSLDLSYHGDNYGATSATLRYGIPNDILLILP